MISSQTRVIDTRREGCPRGVLSRTSAKGSWRFGAICVLGRALKIRQYFNHLLLLILYYLYQFHMFGILKKLVEKEVYCPK